MTDEFQHLREAGIAVYPDNRQLHIRFLDGNRARVRRFERLQREVLALPHASDVALLASLVVFDLIPLQTLLESLQKLNEKEHFTESLDGNGTIQRRLLSIFTLARLKAIKNTAKAIDVQLLVSWLKTTSAYEETDLNELEKEIELDAIAWGSRNLPMPIWSHLSRIQPMASLPTLGFKRYMGLPTPHKPLNSDDAVENNTGTVLADILDDFKARDSEEKSVDIRKTFNLIDRVIQIFRKKNSAATRTDDHAFVNDLLSVRSIANTMSPQAVWVISWMLDLFESGTPQKPNATFETRARYCRVAAEPLLMGLIASGENFPDFDAEELEAMCLSVMADPTISDKQGLGAAISSFLIFIHEEFDAPLIRPQLHKFIPEVVPRAQFFSLEHIQRALSWIHGQQGADARLKKMAILNLALGYSAPFRRDELQNLRIRNVHKLILGTGYEIEINGKLKTQSSARRVQVVERWVTDLLDEWMDMRQNEGANSTDLLFGSFNLPKVVYRRSACNRLLLRVLKLSTGDESMTFHALRHSWATRNIEAIFRSSSIVSFDRLAHVAYQMGHASAQMTLRFYFHTFEVVLKHCVDLIQRSIELTALEASCLTGTKQNTLIQKALRRKLPISMVALETINEGMDSASAQPNVVLDTSVPILLRSFSPQLVPFQILRVLQLLFLGKLQDSHIADRLNLPTSDVPRIRSVALNLAMKLMPKTKRLNTLELQALTLAEALKLSDVKLDAVRNTKFKKLRDYLQLPVDIGLVAAASESWLRMHRYGHLDASDEVDLAKLLRLMKAAEIDPRHLMLRIEAPDLNKAQIALELAPAVRVFTSAFGQAPRCDELSYVHPARPRLTLVWIQTFDDQQSPAPAAVGVTGLNALMFSLHAFLNLCARGPQCSCVKSRFVHFAMFRWTAH